MKAWPRTVRELGALVLGGTLAAATAAAFGFGDRALATVRVALNFSAFGLPSFNPAERVLTFDHPLWAAAEAAAIAWFRNYPAAIETAACAGAGFAAWLALRRADPLRALPLFGLLLGLPIFVAGLADGGASALVVLLLSGLAAAAGDRAGRLPLTALLAALLFLARFPAAALAAPLLLRGALARPPPRELARAALGLLPGGLWLAGTALYFGGVTPHGLHGDLPWPGLGPGLRERAAAALRFGAQQPLAAAVLILALAKAGTALRPGALRDFGDWLGLSLAVGVVQAFLAGESGWEPGSAAVLLWLAFLALAADRRWRAGTLALVTATIALAFAGLDLRHWPGRPEAPPAPSAWPSRRDWIVRRPARGAPRLLVLDPAPGRAGLEKGPAAYVLDGAALADPFWSAANRAAGAEIEGARPVPAAPPGSFAPIVRRAALDAAITLELRLRPLPPGTLEPLVAAGTARGGDLYAIRYLPDRRIYFEVSKYESALTLFSRTISDVDFGRPHRLTVQYGRPARPGGLPENLVIWDGRLVKEISAPLRIRRFTPPEIVIGWNTVGARDCRSRFSGDILAAAPAGEGELRGFTRPEFPLANRSILLRVQPAADEPAGQPLIVTGREFAGDSFSLWKVDARHVRVGRDHWGDRAIEWGPDLPFDFSRPHDIDVLVLERGFAGRLDRPLAVVRIDRQVALVSRKAFNPFRPDQVYALENPLQMSSCGQYFEGRVLATASRPPPPEDIGGIAGRWEYLRRRPGNLDLTAMFDPGAPLGIGQALVETGRTGRGDILYVTRDGPGSFHFGFDHWGLGGYTGPPLSIDPAVPHHLTVEMASLLASADRVGSAGRTVRVTLDGLTVFRVDSPCHDARPDELYIAANRLGASTTGEAFSGLILDAHRL